MVKTVINFSKVQLDLDMSNFQLPSKLNHYLHTLNLLYEKQNEQLLREIVVNAELSVQEEYNYNDWNGGSYGHALTLTIYETLFLAVIDTKNEIQDRIREDINKLDNTQNEYIAVVFIEMLPTNDNNWRKQTNIYKPVHKLPIVDDNTLQRIMGKGTFSSIFKPYLNV